MSDQEDKTVLVTGFLRAFCIMGLSAFERIPIDMTQNASFSRPLSIKLAHMPLLFGIMDKQNIAKLVNDRIPNTDSDACIQSGELFRILCARYLSGLDPEGIDCIPLFAKSLPATFLGVKESATENPYTLVKHDSFVGLLDRIVQYGPTRFSSEIISTLVDNKSVEVVYIDSTTYHVHDLTHNNADEYEDDSYLFALSNKPITQAKGSSAVDKAELPQLHHLDVRARVNGIESAVLLYQANFEEDLIDSDKFRQFCADGSLSYLKENYPNLKVLVGDFTLASAQAIQACQASGVALLSRLPRANVKRDFAAVNAGKIQLSSCELTAKDHTVNDSQVQSIQYAWLDPAVIKTKDKSEISVQRILFVDESLRNKKTASLQAKADKELKEVKAALKKLSTSTKLSKEEATEAFDAIKSKLMLVTVDQPVYEEVKAGGSAKASKAASDKNSATVKVTANASIDEVALQAAINSELFYVLASTDMHLEHTQEVAIEIYKIFNTHAQNETQWSDIRGTGTSFDKQLLETTQRCTALLAALNIALFVGKTLLTHVHELFMRKSISLPTDNTPTSLRPSFKSFVTYVLSGCENSNLLISPDTVYMPDDFDNSILYLVAQEIGQSATRLCSQEYYEQAKEYIYKSKHDYQAIQRKLNHMS